MATLVASEDVIRENERELAGFAAGHVTDVSPVLERVLEDMRRTGVPCYAWPHLKLLLLFKLKLALAQLQVAEAVGANGRGRHEERCANVTELLNTFQGPPFTLQRLTEIIMEPQRSYKSIHKLINALEKLLAVSSTIQVMDPRSAQLLHEQNSPSPSPVASPTGADLSSTPSVLVSDVAGGVDPVARAPWGVNSSS